VVRVSEEVIDHDIVSELKNLGLRLDLVFKFTEINIKKSRAEN